MRFVSSDQMEMVLSHRDLLETLRSAYRSDTVAPRPAYFEIERPEANTNGKLWCRPAWTNFSSQGHTNRGYIGLSITSELPVQPQSATGFLKRKNPTPDDTFQSRDLSGLYLLMSGTNGEPIAVMDGLKLRAWRQATLHALATHYLAREDSTNLLVFGTNSPNLLNLLKGYACAREIRSVLFVGPEQKLCRNLSSEKHLEHIHFNCTEDITGAIEGADIISIADGNSAILESHHLNKGVHVDLVEARADLILKGTFAQDLRLFISDRQDQDLGDLPEIAADLRELAKGEKAGRRFYDQKTLFVAGKATGLADLATAGHIYLRS